MVEKPLADTASDGTRLVEAGEARGVLVLTGHHRRHNALVRRARAVNESGKLGTLVAGYGTIPGTPKPDLARPATDRRRPVAA